MRVNEINSTKFSFKETAKFFGGKMTWKINWMDVVNEYRRLLPPFNKATKYHYDSTAPVEDTGPDTKVMIEGPQPDSIWGELLFLDAIVCSYLNRSQTSSLRTVNHHILLQNAIKNVIRRGTVEGGQLSFEELCLDHLSIPPHWTSFDQWTADAMLRRPHKSLSFEKMNRVVRACDVRHQITLVDLLNHIVRKVWFSESTNASSKLQCNNSDKISPPEPVSEPGCTDPIVQLSLEWHEYSPSHHAQTAFDPMNDMDDILALSPRETHLYSFGEWDSLSRHALHGIEGETVVAGEDVCENCEYQEYFTLYESGPPEKTSISAQGDTISSSLSRNSLCDSFSSWDSLDVRPSPPSPATLGVRHGNPTGRPGHAKEAGYLSCGMCKEIVEDFHDVKGAVLALTARATRIEESVQLILQALVQRGEVMMSVAQVGEERTASTLIHAGSPSTSSVGHTVLESSDNRVACCLPTFQDAGKYLDHDVIVCRGVPCSGLADRKK